MKRTLTVLCLFMLVLSGCSKTTPKESENTIEKIMEAIDLSDKIENYESIIYTKENDPLQLMGKKGQYIAYAKTTIKIINTYYESDETNFEVVEDGFINIEKFDNEDDLNKRYELISSTLSLSAWNIKLIKTNNYVILYPISIDSDSEEELIKIIKDVESKQKEA